MVITSASANQFQLRHRSVYQQCVLFTHYIARYSRR